MEVILTVLAFCVVWALPARALTLPEAAADPRTIAVTEAASSPADPASVRQTTEPARKSAVSGSVVDQSGQPLPNATVYLRSSGSGASLNRTEWTDDDGKFQFSGLYAGVYIVSARVPTHYMDSADDQPIYVRIGSSVKIRMIKGGIITGKVTSLSGDPLIAAAVKPTRIRDQEGKPVNGGPGLREFLTDDRGVYRIYGLPAGSYVVSVGGGRGYGPQQRPYDLNVPTYYPSSTRDTASEVVVGDGQEAAGIDIKYRDEPGYRVSGTVAGIPGPSASLYVGTGISLINVKSGFIEASSYVQSYDPNKGFIFYGVADGVYDVTAMRIGGREDGLASSPHRITVKGADVTGLQLTLAPLGKISGQVVLDPVPEGRKKDETHVSNSSMAEILVTARREGNPDPRLPATIAAAPDEKGLIVFSNLAPATYRFDVNLPSEDMYLRQLSSGKMDKPAQRPSGRPAPTSTASDVAARGMTINSDDHINGLSVVVGREAAYLAGAVTPALEGSTLRARIRLCLVPVETERAGDVLYYRQTTIASDGRFAIANVAPGKYRIVAVAGPADDSLEHRAAQIAWDPAARKQLRQRAESDGLDLELAPRKKIKDFVMKYKPD